jgi:hypothetical protein
MKDSFQLQIFAWNIRFQLIYLLLMEYQSKKISGFAGYIRHYNIDNQMYKNI